MKTTALGIALLVVLLSSMTPAFAQTSDKECDACGMTVDSMGQTRFKIVDPDGNRYYACCPGCAFRLLKTNAELNITSFCDLNGPAYPITIAAKKSGSIATISPTSALVIAGGSCTKNRIVYNAAAADELLGPLHNGTSQWLSPMTNATVLPNCTRIGLAEAVLKFGEGTISSCEKCGMNVDPTGQARLRILDANGTTHIACCPMCALKLLNTTNGQFSMSSYCDYYGPSVPINVRIGAFGSDLQVTPSTVLLIMGGGCTKNRIVVNSTAADALLSFPNNGTSKWLSPMTNDTLLANSTRMTVAQAVQTVIPEFSAPTMILAFVVLSALITLANKHYRRPQHQT